MVFTKLLNIWPQPRRVFQLLRFSKGYQSIAESDDSALDGKVEADRGAWAARRRLYVWGDIRDGDQA